MIDTHKYKKEFYYKVLDLMIIAMFSAERPIEELRTSQEIESYQQDALKYYSGKWSKPEDRFGDFIENSLAMNLFRARVNQAMAHIMVETDMMLDNVVSELSKKLAK